MSSIIEAAEFVSRWPGQGIKFPEFDPKTSQFSDDLAKVVEGYETIKYLEVARPAVFDLSELTPENAEDKLRAFAALIALQGSPETGGLSALAKAKNIALESAARHVANTAGPMVRYAIEQLTPEFEQDARTYVECVAALPDDFTAETLLAAGTDVVTAYQRAKAVVIQLDRVSSFIAATSTLPTHSVTIEPVIRILRPASITELAKLDAAHATPANATLRALNPIYWTAAREGIEFGINTLREAAALRKRLETVTPQQIPGVATLR
ncbi:hypothetical protein B1R94_22170 [Mycolicibacterium litorale]|nr:hypothetical protein B1R94_22170 [Mycolicibacterium litorale]